MSNSSDAFRNLFNLNFNDRILKISSFFVYFAFKNLQSLRLFIISNFVFQLMSIVINLLFRIEINLFKIT
jgi:hypothetical protein